jgi:hypothetical protein
MRLLIWGLYALTVSCLALLAWGCSALFDVVGPLLAQPPEAWKQALAAWQAPAWLGWWVNIGAWEATRQMALWVLEGLATAGPWVATLVGWVPVLIWAVWGAMALGLLALAMGLHVLVSRHEAGESVAAGAARWLVARRLGWGYAAWQLLRRKG